MRPLRSGADHAVVPRRRRVLDRRVRDLLRADGRVAIARHRAAGRPARAHARGARSRSPRRRSPSSTGSTTTCATFPTTTTRTRGREGGFFGHGYRRARRGSVARLSSRSSRSPRRAVGRGRVEVALAPAFVYTAPTMPAGLVEVAVELEHRAVARDRDGELRRLARDRPACRPTASSDVNVWREAALVLHLEGDLLARLRLDEGGIEVLVVELHLERGARLRAHVLACP